VKRPREAVPNHFLRSAREIRGWTQEELAEKIGTTSVTISRWESGVTVPSRYFRKKLSVLYEQSIQALGLLSEESISPPRATSSPATSASSAQARRISASRSENCFLFNESLANPGEFFGRRRECDTLLNRTYRKASTSIVGPRRIGKTWLVDYLRLVAQHELGSRYRTGYLDATMPSCKTVKGFVGEALEVLALPMTGNNGDLVMLEKGLKTLKNSNTIPILCIDEFEGLGDRKEFTLDFFRGLRAMAHGYGLVLITISRQPLSAVVGKDVETSGFFNIFEQVTLEPFTYEEAADFIQEKSKQANFTEPESQCLWKYGEESEREWPALRLQLVGKMLMEERGQRGNDAKYWQRFEQRLEEIYKEVVF
jgi:transcriptional regulator with XRE-family HTH domain